MVDWEADCVYDMGQEGMREEGSGGGGEYGVYGQRGTLLFAPLGVHLHVCPILCLCAFTLAVI